MQKHQNRNKAKYSSFFQFVKSLFQGKKQNPVELSNKSIDDLLEAVNNGYAYEYLNDVEPLNTLSYAN